MMRTLNLDGEEGEISTEDAIELIRRDVNHIKVSDITRLYTSEKDNLELLRRALHVEALSESWQRYLGHQIKKASHETDFENFNAQTSASAPPRRRCGHIYHRAS